MFPGTVTAVLMIVGVIWMIQGFGVFDTGSFMDEQPFWGGMGALLFLAGLAGAIYKRRRSRKPPD